MAIIFAGGLTHEFVNADRFMDPITYDARYGLGSMRPTEAGSVARMIATPVLVEGYDFWLHFNALTTNPDYSTSSTTAFEVVDTLGNVLFWASHGAGGAAGLYFNVPSVVGAAPTTTNDGVNMRGIVAHNRMLTFDFNLRQDGVNHILDIYIEGILIGTHSRARTSQRPVSAVRMGNLVAAGAVGYTHYSEVLMAVDEKTLGWRLSSMVPEGPAAINSWEGGNWPDLATDDPAEGVSTSVEGSRIAGAFSDYLGPANPLGVRALVQTARYIDNESELTLRGFMRNGTNFDTPSAEVIDNSRSVSIWDINPIDGQVWDTADFATINGGFRSALA